MTDCTKLVTVAPFLCMIQTRDSKSSLVRVKCVNFVRMMLC